jgi:hypothetical protein
MEVLSDNLLIAEMLVHNGADIGVGQMAITEGTRPNREIWTVVAATLTATGTYLAGVGESGLRNGEFEGVAERFTVTKRTMTEIDAGVGCAHMSEYSTRGYASITIGNRWLGENGGVWCRYESMKCLRWN